MNQNRRYITVGLFIMIGTIAMVFIGIWLSFGLNQQKMNNFVAVFRESVDGLNVNSDVKFNGVTIGKVIKIKLDHQNPRNTIVTMAIEDGTPITVSTYGVLKPQGITGLSYIELQIDGQNISRKLNYIEPRAQPPYPEIQTRRSLFTSLTTELSNISQNIDHISKNILSLTSNKNVDHINKILSNLEGVTQSLLQNSQKFDHSMDSVNQVLHSLQDLSKTLKGQTLPEVNQAILPNLNQAIQNVNQAASEFQILIKNLNKNPSELIRGRAPLAPGPGE